MSDELVELPLEEYREEIAFLRGQLDTVIFKSGADWLAALAYVLAEPHDADWYRRYVRLLEDAATEQEEGHRRVMVYGCYGWEDDVR